MTASISAVLCIGAGEIIVRLLLPEDFFWLAKTDVYRAVVPPVGYTYQPDLDTVAFKTDLRTNSLGFRGPEPRLAKADDVFRIALIGDSHAFGFGVAFEHSVGEVLASLLNRRGGARYEVLNFAVNGYNSRQELAVLHDYALRHQPDLVLIILSSNDHEPALVVNEQGWLRSTLSTEYRLGKLTGGVSWLLKNSRLAVFLKTLRMRYLLARTSDARAGDNTTPWLKPVTEGTVSGRLRTTVYAPLKAMIELARTRGSRVVVAGFASATDYRQLLARLASEGKVPTLELLTLFPEVRNWQELGEKFGLGWDPHLDAMAHRRWAVALARLIEAAAYLPASER